MRYHPCITLRVALIGAILVGAIGMTGCRESSETSGLGDSSRTTVGTSTREENIFSMDETGSPAVSPSEEPEPAMPSVELTESLAKTCLVKVGDMMPEATLAMLNGQAVTLRSLAGEKLTVICFWKADHPYSLEELHQLQTFIAEPYSHRGVHVIAINEDDRASTAGNALRKTGATYPCLLDSQGNYFAQVATQDLPRTYLLDAEGKVLWFDIGYSRSTLRDLKQGIQFVLEGNVK